ncbi:MAG TPA: GIDE domain-containing protein, partial [Candidatus Binatia bacterium]|nr:GIDE domain-containing protein [Candidatus Binatia bacterium]
MEELISAAPYLPVLGGVLALLTLIAAYRAGHKRRLIDNIPTSKTTGVFMGLVEVKGHADTTKPLMSYLSAAPCVDFHWRVDEHWSRIVTETEQDSEGRTRTRIRHESGWQTVASGGATIPFYLRDDCGEVLVMPEGAEIEPLDLLD